MLSTGTLRRTDHAPFRGRSRTVGVDTTGRRLRVVFVFRWPGRNEQSIERLFTAVAARMPPWIEVVPYTLSAKWLDLRDVVRLRRLRADVYHVTGDCHQIAWFLPPDRTVVTVHDMIHVLHDLRGLRQLLFRWLWFDGPLARVAAITAISEATRRDLYEHCPTLRRRRIDVVPNCVPPLPEPIPKPFDPVQPVILQVGTAPHKNLHRVVQALNGIRCRLVVVGPLRNGQESLLAGADFEVDARGRVSDEGLGQAYREADIVVFASLREGFGLPILEAQAMGRPLVTSDRSPMREVAGGAAVLVDPEDVASIRGGIVRLIEEAELRAHVVARGFDNVRRYRPERIAARYAEVYARITNGAFAPGVSPLPCRPTLHPPGLEDNGR